MPAELESKPVYSGIVTAKPASAPSIARPRCIGALRSSPVASTSSPARIGTQMASDRKEIALGMRPPSAAQEPVGEEHDADQHRECVLVDQPALEQARNRGEPADRTPGAVH